jgi:hypothetical protein
MLFQPRPCIYRALMRSIDRDRANSFGNHRGHFAGAAVKLLQSVALHLQLHLRVLLEDLRVTLAQHLSHPFVRYSSCTQPSGIGGSKVVDSEVGDLCPPKRFGPNLLEGGLVSPLVPVTRKQKGTLLCNCDLPPKGFERQSSQGNLCLQKIHSAVFQPNVTLLHSGRGTPVFTFLNCR